MIAHYAWREAAGIPQQQAGMRMHRRICKTCLIKSDFQKGVKMAFDCMQLAVNIFVSKCEVTFVSIN